MSEHPVPGEGFWYLGGPYSDNIPERYPQHLKTSYFLIKSRLAIYSPIVHCHVIAEQYKLPTSADFWEDYNFNMIRSSKGMILVELPNWKNSKGLAGEILFCSMKSLPVWGIKPPQDLTFEWTRLF